MEDMKSGMKLTQTWCRTFF